MKTVKDIMVSVVESAEELESSYEVEVSFSLRRSEGKFVNMQSYMSIISNIETNSQHNELEESKWF
ncbi:hypothetical protein [Vreelandella indica]|uniref:hypothetical protein n=1 Tax=Vreelandella indica TaxID=3126500 RepID=UPI00300DE0BF